MCARAYLVSQFYDQFIDVPGHPQIQIMSRGTFSKLKTVLYVSSSFGVSSPEIKSHQPLIASLYRITHWPMTFDRAHVASSVNGIAFGAREFQCVRARFQRIFAIESLHYVAYFVQECLQARFEARAGVHIQIQVMRNRQQEDRRRLNEVFGHLLMVFLYFFSYQRLKSDVEKENVWESNLQGQSCDIYYTILRLVPRLIGGSPVKHWRTAPTKISISVGSCMASDSCRWTWLKHAALILPNEMDKRSRTRRSPATGDQQCGHQFHGVQYGHVTERTHLWIGQSSQQQNQMVHQRLIENDGTLTLLDQRLHEIAEIRFEFFPLLAGQDVQPFLPYYRKIENRRRRNGSCIESLTSSNSSVILRIMTLCSMNVDISAVIRPCNRSRWWKTAWAPWVRCRDLACTFQSIC